MEAKNASEPMWFRGVVTSKRLCLDLGAVFEGHPDVFLAVDRDEIINAVGKGDTVTIPGFGTFHSRLLEERTGRNPQTGEEITLPACKVPTFKSGKRMREAVRNS